MLTELDMLSREGIELLEELRRKVEHAAESLYERRRMPVDCIHDTNASFTAMKDPGLIDRGIPEPYPFDVISSLLEKWKVQAALYHDSEDCL